jgi:hypothetical protein
MFNPGDLFKRHKNSHKSHGDVDYFFVVYCSPETYHQYFMYVISERGFHAKTVSTDSVKYMLLNES